MMAIETAVLPLMPGGGEGDFGGLRSRDLVPLLAAPLSGHWFTDPRETTPARGGELRPLGGFVSWRLQRQGNDTVPCACSQDTR
jgi:hypothetical protein